jgi:hypothetical protein
LRSSLFRQRGLIVYWSHAQLETQPNIHQHFFEQPLLSAVPGLIGSRASTRP